LTILIVSGYIDPYNLRSQTGLRGNLVKVEGAPSAVTVYQGVNDATGLKKAGKATPRAEAEARRPAVDFADKPP
jgi:hypothetical protein